MKTTTENQEQVAHDRIARRVRQIWERERRPTGWGVEYWLQAERELGSGTHRTNAPPPNQEANAANDEGQTFVKAKVCKSRTSTARTIHI